MASWLLITALAMGGCTLPARESGGKAAPRSRKETKFPVEVRKIQASPVEYSIQAVGTVEAFEKVEIVARVAGVLEKVSFEEGNRVTTSQILAEIDPERYRLAVSSAQATLARAEAGQAEAVQALDRRKKLTIKAPGVLTEEEMATAIAKTRIQEAEVAQAKAALALAETDLKESSVRSPVDGVVQTRQAGTGQFVQRGAVIATLIRRDPMLLRFTVPAVDAARLKGGMTVRFQVAGFDRAMSAIISHVAEAADPTSRMVNLSARIDDHERNLLKPGSFAEVTVPIDSGAERPVVTQSAIRPSERGYLAYVVEKDVARERSVTLGLRTADGQVEIRSGLSPGEMLVVRGAEPLSDGVKVQVEAPRSHKASPATPAPSPEAKP